MEEGANKYYEKIYSSTASEPFNPIQNVQIVLHLLREFLDVMVPLNQNK